MLYDGILDGILVRAGLSVNSGPYLSLNSRSTSSTVRSACPDIFIHELTKKGQTKRRGDFYPPILGGL